MEQPKTNIPKGLLIDVNTIVFSRFLFSSSQAEYAFSPCFLSFLARLVRIVGPCVSGNQNSKGAAAHVMKKWTRRVQRLRVDRIHEVILLVEAILKSKQR